MSLVEKLKFSPQLKHYILYGGNYDAVLQYTVMKGQPCNRFTMRCAYLIMSGGANVDMEIKDELGVTLLMAAVENGHPKLAKQLIHAGANVHVNYGNGQAVVMRAIEREQWVVVKELIREGAEITSEEFEGNSAVSRAVNRALEKRKRRMYYAQYRDVLRKDMMRIVPGSNLLAIVRKLELEELLKEYIVYGGHDKCLGLLLKDGADVNMLDERGNTCLLHAAHVGHKKCVKFLIDRSANVNIANFRGETALMKAAKKGHDECAKLLTEAGAR